MNPERLTRYGSSQVRGADAVIRNNDDRAPERDNCLAKTRADRRWWVEQFLADRFGRGPLAIDRLTPRDMADFLGQYSRNSYASLAIRYSF